MSLGSLSGKVVNMQSDFRRLYRPSRVSELDQKRVREFFEGVLKSGRISSAYLFTGPKGTGKTSTARILAAVLNCEKNEKLETEQGRLQEPCGKCEMCMAIRKGRSTAVVEIDAASNRGIDDVRQLRERVGLMPTEGRRAVYIVDEVHMLTKEAFNALLKTLEEPPEHVVFCLCTTEEEKLPGTIISRCTRVGYTRATKEEIVRSLRRVIKKEKLDRKLVNEEEVLEAIAGSADGSFRDAIKVLEQVADEEKIELADVLAVVGTGVGGVDRLMMMMEEGRVREALEVVEEMEMAGADMKLVSKRLVALAMERLRMGVRREGKVEGKMVELIEVVSKAFSRFGQVPIPALPVEMAVVEYGLKYSSEVEEVDDVGKEGEKETEGEVDKEEMGAEGLQSVDKEIIGSKRKKVEKKLEKNKNETSGTNKVKKKSKSLMVELKLEEVKKNWGKVLAAVEKENHGLVTVLKRAEVCECGEDGIGLVVSYKFHKEQLEQQRYLSVMERVVEEVFGSRVKLNFRVEKGRKISPEMASHDNVTAVVPREDQDLIETVEEVFGE